VDANVIIKQIRLQEVLGIQDDHTFNTLYEVHTLAEILSEIRDQNARNFLQSLPYEIKVHSGDSKIHKSSLIQVQNFSKDTGDFKTLSANDIKVIALGV